MLQPSPFLNIGDTIAITAPASKVDRESLIKGIEILENDWGLKVIVGKTVDSVLFNYAGNQDLRQSEFQHFLDDPQIKLIIAARGGYGCSKFIDELNFDKFIQNPKWICGFSDLTAMILEINKLGFQAIHGPMVKTMSFDVVSNQYLKEVLFGDNIIYTIQPHKNNRLGIAKGEASGGNLVLLTHSLGSKSEINFKDKILFIEDIGEYYYNIDRMMVQLKRARKLENLAALVVGDFSNSKNNNEAFGKNIPEIILEHCQCYQFPIVFDFPFGHENRNLAIVMGAKYDLDVSESNVSISQCVQNE